MDRTVSVDDIVKLQDDVGEIQDHLRKLEEARAEFVKVKEGLRDLIEGLRCIDQWLQKQPAGGNDEARAKLTSAIDKLSHMLPRVPS